MRSNSSRPRTAAIMAEERIGLVSSSIRDALVGGTQTGSHPANVLEPHWLAIALFVAVPAAGAGFIAWLTAVYPQFWWRNRAATIVTGLAAIPSVIFFPVALAALLVAACWWAAMRSTRV